MKFSIEIEDIKDKRACLLAIRKLYSALEEHYGRIEANTIWLFKLDPLRWELEKKFVGASHRFQDEDLGLVLEYYAMPNPSKRKLATDLAKKNETLPPEERYGPNGTTDPDTMHQQIKRVFRNNKEACNVIGAAPSAWRHGALRDAELVSKTNLRAKAWRRGPKRDKD